jgi:HAD superfamily hydrolase (TIGR01509 family)
MVEVLGRRYQAAIFDLDGTLADSMHVWDHICRDWLAEKGIQAASSLEREIAVMTLTESADYVIRTFGLRLAPAEVTREWEAMVLRHYERTVALKKGMDSLVGDLAEQGMKLGIATSCFPAACEALLARHGIRNCFSAIAYADEVNRDKTFPDIYLACARRLGAEPSACVVFEDFPAARFGVRAAGMGLAAVYDERFASRWESFKQAADFVLDGR